MFGMKSKKEKLEAKLAKLLQEAYQLSHTNRKKSDEKTAEADELRKQIDAMD
jgi:polyhydroxyalkanoate synthesis regulator phasin